jgi:2-amino-4-hydroxy-6-hydroxymethyldihydropteridine diphosphokinase
MHNYYLLLGSNLGDKHGHIDKALQWIEEAIGPIVNQSSRYLTDPWGEKEQEAFINMAVHVTSVKDPENVLSLIKDIEKKAGREETTHWGPRVLDIDILYCDDLILNYDHLKIPHPGIYDRNFVLIPMIEIAGEMTDPVKNLTLDELYEKCTDTFEVYLWEDDETHH